MQGLAKELCALTAHWTKLKLGNIFFFHDATQMQPSEEY